MRRSVLLLVTLGALGACAQFPEIDALGPDTAEPPLLLPIDGILVQAGPAAVDPGPALSARAARLKARAAAIGSTRPAT